MPKISLLDRWLGYNSLYQGSFRSYVPVNHPDTLQRGTGLNKPLGAPPVVIPRKREEAK